MHKGLKLSILFLLLILEFIYLQFLIILTIPIGLFILATKENRQKFGILFLATSFAFIAYLFRSYFSNMLPLFSILPLVLRRDKNNSGTIDEILHERVDAQGSVVIRTYRESDRDKVMEICSDVAVLGQPIDQYLVHRNGRVFVGVFKDKDLWGEFWMSYHTDKEPHNILIEELNREIIGYTAYSTVPVWRVFVHQARYAIEMRIKKSLGKFNDHQPTKEFVDWIFGKGRHEMPRVPDNSAYFHIDMKSSSNPFSGIGIRLLKTTEMKMYDEGLESYFGLVLSSESFRTDKVYERLGYEVYDRTLNSFWSDIFRKPVYNLCVVKDLRKIQST
ncbi:MAG: hypothetical protein AABX59_03820 [Nanoarchaeota archaeon]